MLTALILLVISNYGLVSCSTVSIPEIGIVNGTLGYSAWTNRTIHEFHAIPYAKEPSGNLRFKPPVTPVTWNGTLNAHEPGVFCPQISPPFVNIDNENCLTLSVFSNDLQASRPVMVFIHGGWFTVGSADQYRPYLLLEADIVLVVIQYRLGPLGFLSTLSEEIPGNVGLLDMLAALEWVQQHITPFGGDSSLVTVFGESAGAAAVSAMLHSPLVRNRSPPLFHRAIIQSGSVFSPWAICDDPLEGARDIASRVGCTGTTMEQCLQQVSIKNLLEAFDAHRTDMIVQQGYPSVAGTTLVVGGPSNVFPTHPRNTLNTAQSGISVMGGVTREDGYFLLSEIIKLQPGVVEALNNSHDLLQLVRMLHTKFGQTKLDGALDGYSISDNFLYTEVKRIEWNKVVLGLTDICSNHGIKGPVLTDITAFSRANPENVYLYSFEYATEWMKLNLTVPFPYEGAVQHANDMYFLFPWENLKGDDIIMAKTMVQLWTSFAITGVPKADAVPYWPPASDLYGPYLKINQITEKLNYFLNEFSATATKFRAIGSGSIATVPSIIMIILFLVLSQAMN